MKTLNREETKQLLTKLGVPSFLQANTLAGGLYVNYIANVEIEKINDNEYQVSEVK